MKYSLLLLMILWLANSGLAQRVQGTVRTTTGEAIAAVNIAVLNSSRGTVSDADGTFSLTLSPGTYRLSASAVGYATVLRPVTIGEGTTTLPFVLTESTRALSEVVVTSEKSETNPQRTPAAISVIDAQDLQDYRVWSFSDLSGLAPSLQTVEHGGSSSSLFINIRGVMGLHSQSAVATYIDGVYQFESFSVPMHLNNVERIEVLRGPQGTLYGRNAFGGVINIITKAPTNRIEGQVQIGLGNYQQQRYSLNLSTPIIRNKLFVGVSGVFNQRRGIYTNTVTNSWFDRPQSITGGLNLRYLLSDRWTFRLDVRAERNEDYGSYPWVGSDSLLFANPYTVARNQPNIERRNNMNASLKVNYRGTRVQVNAISAYLNYERWFPELLDVDFSAQDVTRAQNRFRIPTFTQEIRLSSVQEIASPLNWTVGTYWWTAPDGTNANTFSRGLPADAVDVQRNSTFNNRGLAFFGQATYAVTDRWSVTAGLRYDYERRGLEQERYSVQPDGTITDELPFIDLASTFEAFTPKVVVSRQVTENTLAYAQYARGFRAGGLNALAPTPADVPFAPEYSNNYEIGLKNMLWNNKLRLNLTGFYLQQRDQQVTVIEDAFFLTRNTGDMNNLGAEVEATMLPVKGLQLEWTASISSAEYVRLLTVVNGENRDLSGNEPLFNPGVASFLAIQYARPLGNEVSAFVRGEHRYTGAYYMNFDNVIRQSSFHVFNARAGVTYRQYELAWWGRNLTDTQYRTWATGVFLLSNPRTWGVTATAKF